MIVLETPRLTLRRLSEDHAGFILRLLNEPSFLRHVGDKGVRSEDDARRYLRDGPMASYARHGFGPYLVERKDDGAPVGMCGLLRRETLSDPDLGFAFLPEFWSRGYATEAAAAVLAYGRETLGLGRIVAITSPDNDGSIRVLQKLGFVYESRIRLADSEVILFASDVRTTKKM